MLFFWKKNVDKLFFEMKKLYRERSDRNQKNIVTLQVRIPEKPDSETGKRVSFSASASMTVEAALVLPLFLFAGCLLMQPFQILNTQRQVQEILEITAEDLSQNVGIAANMRQEEQNTGTMDSIWQESQNTGTMDPMRREEQNSGTVMWRLSEAGKAAGWAWAEAAVRQKTSGLSIQNLTLKHSQILTDGKTIDLVAEYQIPMPFPVLGLKAVERTNRSFRYAWTGTDGAVDGSDGTQKEDEEVVYVGRDSTRYHKSRSCHYLQADLKAVSYENLDSYRNQDGSRYRPCSRCGTAHGEIVYITVYGDRYHGDTGCSALTSYVREVPKSQVEYLGACSYCGG